MKSMVLSDLLVTRSYATQMLISTLIIGLVIAWGMGNAYATLACVAVAVSYGLGLSLLALDEYRGWDSFRVALPLTRSEIVAGRYASLAIIVGFGVLLGCVAFGAVMALAWCLPGEELFGALRESFELAPFAATVLASASVGFLMLSVVVPLSLYFGMSKGMRLIGLAVAVLLLAFFLGMSQFEGTFVAVLGNAENDALAFVAVFAVLAGISAALYLASAAVSRALYRRREF